MKVLLNVVVHSKGFSNSFLSLKSLLKRWSHDLPWAGLKILVKGTKSQSPLGQCVSLVSVCAKRDIPTRKGMDELGIWVKWNIIYVSK